MNAAIADLQTLSVGSAYDANKQSADHSHVVVDSLRTQLKVSLLPMDWFVVAVPCWAAALEMSTQGLDLKLGCHQDTTKTFKDVMTLRAENLKGNEDRRKLFTGTPDNASPFGGRQSTSLPVQEEDALLSLEAAGIPHRR